MYKISIHGCDDSTYINLELNADELKFVGKLCKLSEENSDYGCQPVMEVIELKESE